MACAAATAVLDRFAVVLVARSLLVEPQEWQSSVLWTAFSLAAMVLLGRSARLLALRLADDATDDMTASAARSLLATDWLDPGVAAAAATISRTINDVHGDARQFAAALPALAALPVTAAWLCIAQPAALAVVLALAVAAGAALRAPIARADASRHVLADAEAAFHAVADRVLESGPSLQVSGETAGAFCADALWPTVDDAARAASLQAAAFARIAAALNWVGFLAVIILLALADSGEQGRAWILSAVVVAATLRHARQSFQAALALRRIGDAAAQLDAVAARFPASATPVPLAPARWTAIAFRDASVAGCDTPAAFFPPVGPIDIELRRGEIVGLTGPNPNDGAALLHMIGGLLPLDRGAALLDGRIVPSAMFRGMCGGVLDRYAVPAALPAHGAAARAATLLARFDLPAALQEQAPVPLTEAERGRLAIVAAELEDRPIRLYDERAMGLPSRFRPAFMETLQEARARGRLCVVANLHPASIAAADRILRVQDGKPDPQQPVAGP